MRKMLLISCLVMVLLIGCNKAPTGSTDKPSFMAGVGEEYKGDPGATPRETGKEVDVTAPEPVKEKEITPSMFDRNPYKYIESIHPVTWVGVINRIQEASTGKVWSFDLSEGFYKGSPTGAAQGSTLLDIRVWESRNGSGHWLDSLMVAKFVCMEKHPELNIGDKIEFYGAPVGITRFKNLFGGESEVFVFMIFDIKKIK